MTANETPDVVGTRPAVSAAQQNTRSWKHYRWLIHPLVAFIITRLLLYGGGYLLDLRLANDPAAPWVNYPDGGAFDILTRWDGEWYLGLAAGGYDYDPALGIDYKSNIAFFPVYPALIRVVGNILGGNNVMAGVLISHAAFFTALLLLYRLTEHEFDEGAAQRVVYYIAVFPTAIFFSAVYTESLFLLLTVAAFYALRKERWLLAGVIGAIATLTRVPGILLAIPYGLEWARRHGWTLRGIVHVGSWRGLLRGLRTDWLALAPVFLIPLGLLLHMVYLGRTFGDPLIFVHIQSGEGWNRGETENPLIVIVSNLIFIVQQFGGAENIRELDWYIWLKPLDLMFGIFFIVVSLLAWRRLGAAYGIHGLLGVLLPIASGNLSMMRFVIVLFPVFMMLAQWGRNPMVDRIILIASALALGMFTAFYVNWVFIG
jgi:hypothetical protein